MSFPDSYLELNQLPNGEWKKYWKRLCQNLGIRSGRDPVWSDKDEVRLSQDSLGEGFFPRHSMPLLPIKPVVPETLWRLWFENE